MSADTSDRIFAEACKRLFELHADGYKRVRPTSTAGPYVPTRTDHQQAPVTV